MCPLKLKLYGVIQTTHKLYKTFALNNSKRAILALLLRGFEVSVKYIMKVVVCIHTCLSTNAPVYGHMNHHKKCKPSPLHIILQTVHRTLYSIFMLSKLSPVFSNSVPSIMCKIHQGAIFRTTFSRCFQQNRLYTGECSENTF